jgi:hypothetical protein
VLDLCDKTDYPVMLLPYAKRGMELPASQLLLRQAKATMVSLLPELLHLRGAYCTKNIFDKVCHCHLRLLIKSKEPSRNVHRDSQLLFQSKEKFPYDIIKKKVATCSAAAAGPCRSLAVSSQLSRCKLLTWRKTTSSERSTQRRMLDRDHRTVLCAQGNP